MPVSRVNSHLILQKNSKEDIFDDITEENLEGRTKYDEMLSNADQSQEQCGDLPTEEFGSNDDFVFAEMMDDMTDILFGSELLSHDDIDFSLDTKSLSQNGGKLTQTQKTTAVKSQYKRADVAEKDIAPKPKKSRSKKDTSNDGANVCTPDFTFAHFAGGSSSTRRIAELSDDPSLTSASINAFVNRFKGSCHLYNSTASTPQGKKSRGKLSVYASPSEVHPPRAIQQDRLLHTVGSSTQRLRHHEAVYGSRRASLTSPSTGSETEGGSTLTDVLRTVDSLSSSYSVPTGLGRVEPFRAQGGFSTGNEMLKFIRPVTHRAGYVATDNMASRSVTGDMHNPFIDGDVVMTGGVRMEHIGRTGLDVYSSDAFLEELMRLHPPSLGSQYTGGLGAGVVGKLHLSRNTSTGSTDSKRPGNGGRARSSSKIRPPSQRQSQGPPDEDTMRSLPPHPRMSVSVQSQAPQRLRSPHLSADNDGVHPPSSPGIMAFARDSPSKRGRAWEGDSSFGTTHVQQPAQEQFIGNPTIIDWRPTKRMQTPSALTASRAAGFGSSMHFDQAILSMPQPPHPASASNTQQSHSLFPPHSHTQTKGQSPTSQSHHPLSEVDLSTFFSAEEIDDILTLVSDMEGQSSSTHPPDRVELMLSPHAMDPPGASYPIGQTNKRKFFNISTSSSVSSSGSGLYSDGRGIADDMSGGKYIYLSRIGCYFFQSRQYPVQLAYHLFGWLPRENVRIWSFHAVRCH